MADGGCKVKDRCDLDKYTDTCSIEQTHSRSTPNRATEQWWTADRKVDNSVNWNKKKEHDDYSKSYGKEEKKYYGHEDYSYGYESKKSYY